MNDDLAYDLGDEKRLRQAENRAMRAIKEKRRFQPYTNSLVSTSTASDGRAAPPNRPFRSYKHKEASPYDVCFKCHKLGHWKSTCTAPSKSSYSSTNTPTQ